MKKKIFLILAITCGLFFLVKHPIVIIYKNVKVNPVPISVKTFNLSESELQIHKSKAESGSAASCRALSNYYHVTKNDDKTGLYWDRRAVELGDVTSIRFLENFAKTKNIEKDNSRVINREANTAD
jgi:flagellar basal body L-ring protein FlgH